jgi:diguanylate cyclase (GGDEF)-like protein
LTGAAGCDLIRAGLPPNASGIILEVQDPSLLLLHEDVGESYDAVTRSAAAAVGAESCQLTLYDEETGELIARRPRYDAPGQRVPQYRFRLDSSPASVLVLRTGQPYLSNDAGSDPLYDPSVKERGVRSVLTVPVRRGSRILGFLYAINKPGGFKEEDARTLSALAGAAAVTLENIRLYARERERRLLSDSLREVSRTLIGSYTEHAALATVLDQMWRVVRYQAAAAVMREGDRLRVAAARGGDGELEVAYAEAGSLRRVLESKRIEMLADSDRLLPRLGMRDAAGTALAAPMVAQGESVGALVVGFDPELPPGFQDGQLVMAFADHAALFLEAGSILRRERQARARAAALGRITRLAASRHEPESLLQAVAPEFLALAGADRAIVYSRHHRDEALVPVADAGTLPEEEERVHGMRLELGTGTLLPLSEPPRPLAFHADNEPVPSSLTPFDGTKALLVLPLSVEGKLLGAVVLVCLDRPRACDASQMESLQDAAQQVALGMENARLFSALSQMASTDELTRLANRRRFTESLRMEMARMRRSEAPLSLIMADADHLKAINDAHGHPAGDAAIRHVAEAIRKGGRETDMAARLGGEEFALLLPGTDAVGAVKAAERIRKALASTTIPNVGTVTVSMGVATAPEDAAAEEELVRVADARLYAAKARGRNQVCAMVPSDPPSGPGNGRRGPES